MLSKFCAILAAGCAALTLTSWVAAQSGRAVSFAAATLVQADPHHPGTVVAGSAAAVLFRSRDGADSWSPLPFPAELKSALHGLWIDPSRPGVYFVAVSSESPELAGVYRSMDEGATWEQLPDLRQKQVWSLTAWSKDPRVMAAGTQDGIFLTNNGGDGWIRMSPAKGIGPRPVVSLAFAPADSKTLYAGTPHLAWKTSNGGVTWRRIERGMQADSDIFALTVDQTRPERLFAGACSGIYRSQDGGATWISMERQLGEGIRTYAIAGQPKSPGIVFAGTSMGLFESRDSGVTWRKLSGGTARSIAFDAADPRHLYIASDRGVLRSEDGGAHFREGTQGADAAAARVR